MLLDIPIINHGDHVQHHVLLPQCLGGCHVGGLSQALL